MEKPFDMGDTVGRNEFAEFQKRLEDKKAAWDKDLADVKAEVKEIRNLTTSVAELAQSMKAMAEQRKSIWNSER